MNSIAGYDHMRNLRRSRTRLDILFFLANLHPESVPLSEIARGTGHSPTDIAGAIRGMGNRFLSENSLVSQGLVDRISSHGRTYYQASFAGLDALKKMIRADSARFEARIAHRIVTDGDDNRGGARLAWRNTG